MSKSRQHPDELRWVAGKSRFDDIYGQPDPRPYFGRLAPLGYEIPHHAQPIFRRIAAERSVLADNYIDKPAVLDLCCSYGINAALLNHDVTLAELYERYTSRTVLDLTTAELINRDRDFYAKRRRPGAVPVLGLDVSTAAVRYACAVGLLDTGFTDDLEQRPPGAKLNRALEEVGLITCTGGGSYISSRSFAALVDGCRRPVWISAFVLRTVAHDDVVRVLGERGLHTSAELARTYPQRRFTDEREQRYAIQAVRARHLDPAGCEDAGQFHCVYYESRPTAWS
ncbi:hypothetical protein [Streptomyces sp. 1222.5]|uniref:hypothetical protein n=1 Tax=Streptomyces sp. 1222.5 TaxID=1881026 RepID=UPI003EBCDD97